MKNSALPFLATILLLASAAFACADVVAYYPVTQTGTSRDYFLFGYTAEDGTFVPLTGEQIVSASLTIDYTPAPGEDINNLFIGMAVPTEADEQFFGVMGTDFILTSPGHYHYDLTTDIFNGTIRAGAFGIETYSLIDGEGQATDGQYLEGSGFRYTVAAVPERLPPVVTGWCRFQTRFRRPSRSPQGEHHPGRLFVFSGSAGSHKTPCTWTSGKNSSAGRTSKRWQPWRVSRTTPPLWTTTASTWVWPKKAVLEPCVLRISGCRSNAPVAMS